MADEPQRPKFAIRTCPRSAERSRIRSAAGRSTAARCAWSSWSRGSCSSQARPRAAHAVPVCRLVLTTAAAVELIRRAAQSPTRCRPACGRAAGEARQAEALRGDSPTRHPARGIHLLQWLDPGTPRSGRHRSLTLSAQIHSASAGSPLCEDRRSGARVGRRATPRAGRWGLADLPPSPAPRRRGSQTAAAGPDRRWAGRWRSRGFPAPSAVGARPHAQMAEGRLEHRLRGGRLVTQWAMQFAHFS